MNKEFTNEKEKEIINNIPNQNKKEINNHSTKI